jgi:hypothetical protein
VGGELRIRQRLLPGGAVGRHALVDARPHLPAVVGQVLHDRFGSQVGVAGHGERPVPVDLHAGRQPAPLRGRLRPECDLEEALEHPSVVDARADPLVVLSVAHHQPRPDPVTGGVGARGDDREVGAHVGGALVGELDEGHPQAEEHGRLARVLRR